ncbi:MAG: zinc-dependent alcohol dehydrogenase family protein [Bacteroidales bacterium]|nr:zinc-dependent alcohol dehydrogenase family protein [Bacteroidales bacterium]
MKAMLLKGVYDLTHQTTPLQLTETDIPQPAEDEVLMKIRTCGVCHTEIDEIEGRTPPPFYPVIPGHQAVGEVMEDAADAGLKAGDRVGVAWIYHACGKCSWCCSGLENLCPEFMATGRDVHGGYAEYMIAKKNFVHRIPDTIRNEEAAPMLCAGAIGYRSLRLTEITNGMTLGLAGFGASAHLVMKMISHLYPDTEVIVFARSQEERKFALELGAKWAGDFTDCTPLLPHAIIDTTPVWKPVVESMRHLLPGGRLVINAIRKENHDIHYWEKLSYPDHLWMEKEIKSVANVTRNDVRGFLDLAAAIPIIPEVQLYPLEEANRALTEIKQRRIKGAKVLVVD